MSRTIFLSKPSYLPIYQPRNNQSISLAKYTDVWRNFILADQIAAEARIGQWNGRLIDDVVVFESDKDKMWFILSWS